MQRVDCLEKILMVEKIEGEREGPAEDKMVR